MTEQAAFKMGWEDGANGIRLQTYRQVTTAYPTLNDAEVEAYQNGWEDGVSGERFRLDGGATPPCSAGMFCSLCLRDHLREESCDSF